MQHKGVVKFFAITFILVCLFQLSFTFISYIYSGKSDKYANSPKVKAMAQKMAQGNPLKEEYFYDSISKSRLEYFNDSNGIKFRPLGPSAFDIPRASRRWSP